MPIINTHGFHRKIIERQQMVFKQYPSTINGDVKKQTNKHRRAVSNQESQEYIGDIGLNHHFPFPWYACLLVHTPMDFCLFAGN